MNIKESSSENFKVKKSRLHKGNEVIIFSHDSTDNIMWSEILLYLAKRMSALIMNELS